MGSKLLVILWELVSAAFHKPPSMSIDATEPTKQQQLDEEEESLLLAQLCAEAANGALQAAREVLVVRGFMDQDTETLVLHAARLAIEVAGQLGSLDVFDRLSEAEEVSLGHLR